MRVQCLFYGFCLLLISTFSCAASYNILVIESYHSGFVWDGDYVRALRGALGANYHLETFEMDTKRLPPAQHAERGRQALSRVVAMRPDLVVLGDDVALRLVGPELDKLGIPGVYLGINNNPRNYGEGRFRHLTGVLERPLLLREMIFIQQMIPSTQRILLLFDDNYTSDVIRDDLFSHQDKLQISDMQLDLLRIPSGKRWKDEVEHAKEKGYQVIVVGLYQTLKDEDGKVIDADEVIRWTSSHSPVPVFALWDFAVGSDRSVGGLVMSGNEQGLAAASIVKEILEKKTPPGAIFPVIARQGSFLFSRKQLDRYGLQLPEQIRKQAKLID